MKYLQKVIYIFLIIFSVCFISFGFVSCEKQEETITFDDEYPLALSPSVNWAVIKEPYAAYRKEIGWSASVTGHCRRGEIFQVEGVGVDSQNEKWFHFENGWLPESCLNVYNNRLKAERIASILIKSNEK